MSASDLLHTLAHTPDLEGAACVEHCDLFDRCTEPGGQQAYAKAISICEQCPVLTQCRRWVESLPPRNRPVGVTAGKIKNSRIKSDAA